MVNQLMLIDRLLEETAEQWKVPVSELEIIGKPGWHPFWPERGLWQFYCNVAVKGRKEHTFRSLIVKRQQEDK